MYDLCETVLTMIDASLNLLVCSALETTAHVTCPHLKAEHADQQLHLRLHLLVYSPRCNTATSPHFTY